MLAVVAVLRAWLCALTIHPVVAQSPPLVISEGFSRKLLALRARRSLRDSLSLTAATTTTTATATGTAASACRRSGLRTARTSSGGNLLAFPLRVVALAAPAAGLKTAATGQVGVMPTLLLRLVL